MNGELFSFSLFDHGWFCRCSMPERVHTILREETGRKQRSRGGIRGFCNFSNEKQLIFEMKKVCVFKKSVIKGCENLAKNP